MVFQKVGSQFLTLSLKEEKDVDLDADLEIRPLFLRRLVFSVDIE